MKGHGGDLDFETVIDAGGRIEVPEGILSRPGTQAGSRVRVRLVAAGIAGNLTTDAHLAALAIEHTPAVPPATPPPPPSRL